MKSLWRHFKNSKTSRDAYLCLQSIHIKNISNPSGEPIPIKAKSSLWEVLVDIDSDRLEVQSPELRRALSLTTEDLRFIDHVVRVVVFEEGRDEFLEGNQEDCCRRTGMNSWKVIRMTCRRTGMNSWKVIRMTVVGVQG